MSDPINQLTGDHSQIKRLFNQWSHLGGTEPAKKSASAITGLLKIHTTLEEEFLYPVLMNIDEGLAKQSLSEHAQAGEMIDSIEAMPADWNHPNAGGQRAKMVDAMVRLEEAVQLHVEEEENVTFPKLLANCSSEFLEDMGHQMYRRRQQLLASEHQGVTETRTGIPGRDASPKL